MRRARWPAHENKKKERKIETSCYINSSYYEAGETGTAHRRERVQISVGRGTVNKHKH